MKIELHEITVRELTENYLDSGEKGVLGYNRQLDIRPPYQREFIYKDKQRDAVINTILKNFPLNVMYWAKRENNDEVPYEIIDGQQRTISICQYVNGDFVFDFKFFHSQPKDIRDKILDYKLMIYICSGTDSEKLDWFKVINIAGEKLTDQELRNAVYSGSWVNNAKAYFSKNGCAAYRIAKDFLSGSCIRQEYLETAIKWISDDNIEAYMAKHQQDQNANELWLYFKSVIDWITATFINYSKYKKETKGVNWGELYNKYKDEKIDTKAIDEEIQKLMRDSDVTNKKGIFPYVLTRKEKYLNIRAFDDNTKRSVYEKQMGICPVCHKHFEIEEMEADHITPWHLGGRTTEENCQMLCLEDNRKKGGR